MTFAKPCLIGSTASAGPSAHDIFQARDEMRSIVKNFTKTFAFCSAMHTAFYTLLVPSLRQKFVWYVAAGMGLTYP
jgi:hypothetical protein